MTKIVSVNVEGARHLDLIGGFLEAENPEVVFLQEAFEDDTKLFAKHFGMELVYAPMCRREKIEGVSKDLCVWGAAVLTKYPFIESKTYYYAGGKHELPVFDRKEMAQVKKPLLYTQIKKDGAVFNLANTHFTWTPDGKPTDSQREDLKELLKYLHNYPDIVLCGDFNAPRGGEIWSKLASVYKDNIPISITTTVDKNKHRAGDLQLVVDGLFSTPEYEVLNVEIIDGVSDHCAIVATISRVS